MSQNPILSITGLGRWRAALVNDTEVIEKLETSTHPVTRITNAAAVLEESPGYMVC